MEQQIEALYKIYFEQKHAGLVFRLEDSSFRLVAIGNQYLQQTGLKREVLSSLRLEELPPGLLHPDTGSGLRQVLQQGQEMALDFFPQPGADPRNPSHVSVCLQPLGLEGSARQFILYEVRMAVALADPAVGNQKEQHDKQLDEMRKNDFIAMVSHELKTPLTSLKAYVQLLGIKAKQSQDQLMLKSLGKVEGQVNKLHKMIRSFLDISRLESGSIVLEREVFTVDRLLTEIVEEISITDNTHAILFSACKPLEVYADREKIGQVIHNLLSNAVKYSAPYSKVTIRCELVDEQVRVSVGDEGIGLAKADLKNVFGRFYRVRNKQLKTVSGFGIGLYLSSEIINKHGGHIWVESEENKGSIFHFCLPQRPDQ